MPRTKKRGRGRPPRAVTPEILDAIREALLSMCKHETAANLAGIGLRTFYEWRAKGEEEPQGPYGDFARVVRGAESQLEQQLTASILLHSRSDGKLALEALRARFPKRWPKSEVQRHELRGQVDVEVEVAGGELTRRLDRLLARAQESNVPPGTNGKHPKG